MLYVVFSQISLLSGKKLFIATQTLYFPAMLVMLFMKVARFHTCKSLFWKSKPGL